VTNCLCNIQYESLTLDTGKNHEVVLREWIPCPEDTTRIYNGMPLRPEMRLFYDFDKHLTLPNTTKGDITTKV
jgi:hypothetical protein